MVVQTMWTADSRVASVTDSPSTVAAHSPTTRSVRWCRRQLRFVLLAPGERRDPSSETESLQDAETLAGQAMSCTHGAYDRHHVERRAAHRPGQVLAASAAETCGPVRQDAH